jgi:hypothetical protein
MVDRVETPQELLAQMPEDVPIVMLIFSGQVRDIFEFAPSGNGITQWLKQGPSQRADTRLLTKTALFDPILEALKLLQPFQCGDVLYAITHGGDNASQASPAHTKATLLESGVRLLAFVFDGVMPLGAVQAGEDSFLEMDVDSSSVACEQIATNAETYGIAV